MTPITRPNAQPIHIGRMPPRRDLDGVLVEAGTSRGGAAQALRAVVTELLPTYTLLKKGRESYRLTTLQARRREPLR